MISSTRQASPTLSLNELRRGPNVVIPIDRLALKILHPDALFEQLPADKRTLQAHRKIIIVCQNTGSVEQTALLRIFEKTTDDLRFNIIEKVSDLIIEKGKESVEAALPLIKNVAIELKIDILAAIALLPKSLPALSVQRFIHLLKKISVREHRTKILEVVRELPSTQRMDVIEKALPFLHKRKDTCARKLTALFQNQNISDGIKRAQILEAVALLPLEQRSDQQIRSFLSLFQQLRQESDRTEILKTLRIIPSVFRLKTVEQTLPLIATRMTGFERRALLIVVYGLPQEGRNDIIAAALRFVKDSASGKERAGFLLALQDISYDQRSAVIERLPALFKGSLTISEQIAIIDHLSKIPRDQILDVIEKTIPFIRNSTNGYDRSWLLEIIKDLPSEIRSDVIEKSAPLLYNCRNEIERIRVYKLMCLIPENERANIVIRLQTTPNLSFEDLSAMLLVTPKENRADLIYSLYEHLTLSASEVLASLVASFPDRKEASYAYLAAELETLLPNREQAQFLSVLILHFQNRLLMHDQLPLFQRAVEVYCITRDSLSDDVQNPYYLFHHLLHTVKTEKLLTVPLEPFTKYGTVIDLNGLRSSRQVRFTRSDLSQGSCPNGFKQLFSDLTRRSNPALETEIKNSFELSLAELKENLVNGPFVFGLLQIPEGEEAPVPRSSFRLYAILHYIRNANDARSDQSLLSERERVLLTFAHSMRTCTTGQLDAIALYYNNLPLSFRGEDGAETQARERLNSFVTKLVQSVLNETFASEKLIMLLTHRQDLSQASHQTLYLKNRLYQQIGLHHEPVFDPHTGCIEKTLLTASLQTLMNGFFQVCTAEAFVHKLQTEINRSLANPKSGLMVPLDEYLDEISPSRTEKENLLRYDEESNVVLLTEKGAIEILRHFGILKKDD